MSNHNVQHVLHLVVYFLILITCPKGELDLTPEGLSAYLHTDDADTQVGPPQVNSKRTLCLQNVVNILRDTLLHGRETELLL